MAQLPGYYVTSVAALVTLPKKEMYGQISGEERNDLLMETERGKRYVYNQFVRVVRKYTFRLTAAQLAQFRTLHDLVGGQATAFYYVTSDGDTIYVRKEKDFQYQELVAKDLFDYTMTLTGEPSDALIDA